MWELAKCFIHNFALQIVNVVCKTRQNYQTQESKKNKNRKTTQVQIKKTVESNNRLDIKMTRKGERDER